MLEYLPSIRTLSYLLFIIISSFGCIWQSISLVQLYLTYPTTIQINTHFDVQDDSLAAFTLCKNTNWYKYNHMGKNTSDLFEYYSKSDVIKKLSLEGPDLGIDMDHLLTQVVKLSLSYFCISFRGIF